MGHYWPRWVKHPQLEVNIGGLVRNSKTQEENFPNQPSFTEFKINSPTVKRAFALCSQVKDQPMQIWPWLWFSPLLPQIRATENINPQFTNRCSLAKDIQPCVGLLEAVGGGGLQNICIIASWAVPAIWRGSSQHEMDSFIVPILQMRKLRLSKIE